MNRQAVILSACVLVMVGVAAAVIGRLQASQRLGKPGLKVVAEPILDEIGKVVGTNSVFLPKQVLDYGSESTSVTRLELDWLPPDTTFGRRIYRDPAGAELLLSVVLMGSDRTSIHKPQYCLLGQGFSIDSSEQTVIPVGGPKPFELRVMKLLTTKVEGATRWRGIYVYWFVADGQQTADHAQRMWWMARDLVRDGVLQRWAYVTCFAICRPGAEADAYERVKAFLAAAVPPLHADSDDPKAGRAGVEESVDLGGVRGGFKGAELAGAAAPGGTP